MFPGLAVGEALLDLGVSREEVLYVGGNRLEATVYPDHGFPFLQLELAGLQRSISPRNLRLPVVVLRAARRMGEAIVQREVKAVLGMGGYVTIPAGLAARRAQVPFLHCEQNAEAGLANRVSQRWARRTFGSFPKTAGLHRAEWVGNPVRHRFWKFDRDRLLPRARQRYQLTPALPTLGVVGGSLGAAVINDSVATLAATWTGPAIQIVHITGERHLDQLRSLPSSDQVTWRRIGFEESMELFYACSDLVLARAGGAVAELTATSTPAILVPGEFGSGRHQRANATFLSDAGAAVTLAAEALSTLPETVASILLDPPGLERMRAAAWLIARPEAALTVARAMLEEGERSMS